MLPEVPELVRSLVTDQGHIGLMAGGDRSVYDRLTTYPAMKKVWEDLKDLSDDDYFPVEFFETAVNLRHRWKRTTKLPEKAVDSDLNELSDLCKRLAHKLRVGRQEIMIRKGYELSLWALLAKTLQDQHPGPAADCALEKISQISWEFNGLTGRSTELVIPDALDFLARYFAAQTSSEDSLVQPHKPNAKSAEQTFCVRALAHFFMEATGHPQSSIVAATVATISDLPDSNLDASHVNKLIADLR
jgi:hypothetical protein